LNADFARRIKRNNFEVIIMTKTKATQRAAAANEMHGVPDRETALAAADLPPVESVSTPHTADAPSTSFSRYWREVRAWNEEAGVDTRDWWVDDETYGVFRESVAICNFDLVPRMDSWHRCEAGLFLMGLARKSDPLTCLRQPYLCMKNPADGRQRTIDAMTNSRIAESSSIDRNTPPEWLKFANRHGLKISPDMVDLVAQHWGVDEPVPVRSVNMLHKALGGLMLLCDYDNTTPISQIVRELALKGAPVDRQCFAEHVKRARAAVVGRPDPARTTER